LWYAETEDLSHKLANKSARELQEIFDSGDIIELRTAKDKRVNTIGRLLSVPTFVLLILLSGVKWLVTGDRYLDSWFKQSKILSKIIEYTGIK
jgi:hypothetical protein